MNGKEAFHSLPTNVPTKKVPKTRLGCVTCKARRVKCDEAKPACNRCLRFWGHCEGYPSSLPPIYRRRKKPPSREIIFPILPRPDSSSTPTSPTPRLEKAFQLPTSLPDESPFTIPEEYHYFSIFRNETVAELPGIFGGDLWDRIIPQACHYEDFVCDAAVAIGALSSCGREFTTAGHDGKVTDSIHYCFALAKYGKAIRKMRIALIEGKGGLRMALLACLLVVCFEGLQGNFLQALEHAVSGGLLLQEWMERQDGGGENWAFGSSRNDEIEGEIVGTFRLLDLHVMSCLDARRPKRHCKMKNTEKEMVESMSEQFKSKKKTDWEQAYKRASHSIALSATETWDHRRQLPDLKSEVDSGKGLPAYPINYDAAEDMYRSLPGTLISDPSGKYFAYNLKIAKWVAEFTPFHRSLSQTRD